VAGIIAGRGQPGKGVRGVAPGVELPVYRVFGEGQEKALSFNIAKGIRQAVDDGCDLINLSPGGEANVPDVLREIHRARAMGVVRIAAAGNDYRGTVNYPARYSPVMGVSAFGRKGNWPAGAAQDLEVLKPFGTDRKNFVACFSNVGSEVDLVGPGVGVVSTYPGGYAAMDETSMACPATTGHRHGFSTGSCCCPTARDRRSPGAQQELLAPIGPSEVPRTFEGVSWKA
jgi:subtilisin